MKKRCVLTVISILIFNFGYSQSKANLIKSVEELKVIAIQNQTKIESLQQDIEKLKVHVVIAETKIEIQEKEILKLHQLLGSNNINHTPAGMIPSNVVEPNGINRPSNSSVKSQCKGITKAGNQCKRSGGPNGYCYQHGGK